MTVAATIITLLIITLLIITLYIAIRLALIPSLKIYEQYLPYNISDKKIVVCFMTRNGESYIEKNLGKINKFCKDNFDKYNIIYLENDSNDNTQSILKNLENTMPISGQFLKLKTKMSTDMCKNSKNCVKRFRFLAKLRQKLLDIVKTKYKNYDYMLMMDMDFVDFNDTELKKTFKILNHKNYDAIFGMSIKNGRPYDLGAIMNKIIQLYYSLFYKKKNNIIKVDSAFSGFGIYNIKSLIKNNANYDTLCNDIEHIALNYKLPQTYIYNDFTPIYD